METEWEKFKTGIYQKTMNGSGKNMIKEFNLFTDWVEVYFSGNSKAVINLYDFEVPDVYAFEKELREKGVFVIEKPKSFSAFRKELVKRSLDHWVYITSDTELTSFEWEKINKDGFDVRGGKLLAKDFADKLSGVNGFGIHSHIPYVKLSAELADYIL